ncbi:element excision factor XisH family protein [Geminocystis sp. CENA526]
MTVKDKFHNIVKTALIKDNGNITRDLLILKCGKDDHFMSKYDY